MKRPFAEDPSSEAGLTMHGLLGLPEDQRRLVNWLKRQPGCSMQQMMAFMEWDEAAIAPLLQDLQQQGWITATSQKDQIIYQVNFASMRRQRGQRHALPSLYAKTDEPQPPGAENL